MTLALKHRPQFLLDLAEELAWLNQKAGPEVAERWYEAVYASIEQLQKHPELGRPRPELKPEGIRSWRVKGFARWLLFYSERPDALVFLRLRQGTMNLVVMDLGG
jgi:plasmid stabilization system protein ParE